jgi:hypothetical protein
MTIIPNLLSLDSLPIYLDLVDIMGYYLIQENKTFLAILESKTCPLLWETYTGYIAFSFKPNMLPFLLLPSHIE